MLSCDYHCNLQELCQPSKPIKMVIIFLEGQCGYGQLRCEPDNKCLRNSSVCNGAADCSNYVDESTCGKWCSNNLNGFGLLVWKNKAMILCLL